MKLLTKGLLERFAKVGRQEETADPIVVANFSIQRVRAHGTPQNTTQQTEYFSGSFQFLVIGMTNGVLFPLPSLRVIAANLD